MSSLAHLLTGIMGLVAMLVATASAHASGFTFFRVEEHASLQASGSLDAHEHEAWSASAWLDQLAPGEDTALESRRIMLVEVDLDAEVRAIGRLPVADFSRDLDAIVAEGMGVDSEDSTADIGDLDLASLPALRRGIDLPSR